MNNRPPAQTVHGVYMQCDKLVSGQKSKAHLKFSQKEAFGSNIRKVKTPERGINHAGREIEMANIKYVYTLEMLFRNTYVNILLSMFNATFEVTIWYFCINTNNRRQVAE